MNGRSSFETPNRARTRPSESSISISPALMTRLRIPKPLVDRRRWSLGRAATGMCGLRRRTGRGTAEGGVGRGEGPRKREKPPRPEGPSGLSSRTVWTPYRTVNPARAVLSLFLQPLDAPGGGLEPPRVGVDTDPRSLGDRQRPVGREDERFGQVLGEVPRARARVAGQREVRQRGKREVRRTPDPRR